MTIEEIRVALDNAWHEIGHAYAFVGEARFLSALLAVDSARDSIQLAHDALDGLQE